VRLVLWTHGSHRTVPRVWANRPRVRESQRPRSLHHPYRIVYRLVDGDEIHILTVHHGARRFPESL
jgi:plasmid stabilization system protein ParE